MVYTGVMFFQDKIYEKQLINMAELWHNMGGGVNNKKNASTVVGSKCKKI